VEVEGLRRVLTTDLIHLQSLQSNLNPTELTETADVENAQTESFENLDDEDGELDQTDPEPLLDAGDPDHLALLPEHKPLHLPSSHITAPNQPLRQAELTLRIKQATRYLAALRNAIAEKSFQYSHIMRSAPSKGVRTRSRSAISKISERISQYSRVYSRARAAIGRLGADEKTLNQFKLLQREDLKASTAILKPNLPGSSTLRLSWIWETGAGISGSAPEMMRECKLVCHPEI
jgi:hypothetical protein